MSCNPKLNAYWITFFAYAAIHALRMCYSFNKVNIRQDFHLSEFYLGFIDAVLYISYAIGVFVRYEIFQGNSDMKKVYFITSIIVSFCFGFIAYVAIYSELTFISLKAAQILLTLGVFGFGFFHLAFYQICGAVTSGYYDAKTESAKLGFWGSATSIGNVVGFLISNLAIHQFQLKWEVTFFFMSIVSLIMGFVVYYFLEIPAEDESYKNKIFDLQNQSEQIQIENKRNSYLKNANQQIRTKHWLNFIRKVISTSSQARYTYAAYITTKATVYTFLMWFPIFLVSKNLGNVSGYISTLFDIGGTLGGYLIGKLHRMSYDMEQGNFNDHGELYRMILRFRNTLIILIVIGIILAFIFVDGSILFYCPLTFLIGFFLGGAYNNVSSHQIFKIAQNRMLHTDMLLNLSVGVSCFMVGLIQLITAFLFKWNDKSDSHGQTANYEIFFIVLLVIMVLCMGIMCKRAFSVQKEEAKIHKESIQ